MSYHQESLSQPQTGELLKGHLVLFHVFLCTSSTKVNIFQPHKVWIIHAGLFSDSINSSVVARAE